MAVYDFSFTVPLVPPSVNHYKHRARNGHWYVGKDAIAYKNAVAIFAKGQQVAGKKYQVDVVIYLGAKQRLDHDNGWKVIGDGLKEAGVIQSDAWIKQSSTKMDRDVKNPRTEIRVRTL
jgi:Holliday junction resolvase RusA-like endonuclease